MKQGSRDGTDAARRAGRVAPMAGALLVALALAACAAQPEAPRMAVETPISVLDDYLMARGMAISYGQSGRAGPGQIAQLVRYDHAALLAVAGAQVEPGEIRVMQARQAVQALIAYTAENDLRPNAPPHTPPAGL